MKIISGKRGSGKTKELIQYCLDTDAAIICKDQKHEQEIKEKSEVYFNKVVKTVLLSDLFETTEQNIAIDDVDAIASYLIRQLFEYEGQISCMTISED